MKKTITRTFMVLVQIAVLVALVVGCSDMITSLTAIDDTPAGADAAALSTDNITFSSGDSADAVTGDFILPTTGEVNDSTTISWVPGNTDVITIDSETGTATVTRPADADADVSLTATFTDAEGNTSTETITVTVLATTDAGNDAAALGTDDITFASGDTADAVTGDFTLPITGEINTSTTISWESDNTDIITIDNETGTATVTPPEDDDTEVILTATITDADGNTTTKTITLTVAEGSITETVAKIQPADLPAGASFGSSIAVDGNRALIGAVSDDTGSGFGLKEDAGAVYYYEYDSSSGWEEKQKLEASDGESYDKYGVSVAIEGDTALIGAWSYEYDTTGNTGVVYVYTYDSTNGWEEVQIITPPDLSHLGNNAEVGYFGCSVAMEGTTMAVGGNTLRSTGDDNIGANVYPGSVFIYTYNGTDWEFKQLIYPREVYEDPNYPETGGISFGYDVDISGTHLIVGAYQAQYGGYPGGGSDRDGCVYFYEISDTEEETVATEQQLFASDYDEDDTFGRTVALNGTTAVVGAPNAGQEGKVYIYQYDETDWGSEQIIDAYSLPSKLEYSHNYETFGWALAFDGTDIAVGAPYGDPTYDLSNAGQTFLFQPKDTAENTMDTEQKITVADGAADDNFGSAVGMSEHTLLVGAAGYDEGRGGVYVYTY